MGGPTDMAIRHPLLRIALTALCVFAAACVSAAPSSDDGAVCEKLVSTDTMRKVDATVGRQVQGALAEIYSGDPTFPAVAKGHRGALGDGRIGSVTQHWLRKFCREFAGRVVTSPEAVLDAVIGFAGILHAYPEWREPLLSQGLSHWIEARPAPEGARYRQTRVSGPDKDIDAMLRAWQRPAVTRAESNTVFTYYRLTAADLALLAAPRAALAGLAKLQDKPAADRDAFDATVAAVLTKAGLPPDKYGPIVARHADTIPAVQLTEDSIKKLRVRRLPQAVVDIAESVSGLAFPDLGELQGALEDAAKAANDEAAAADPAAASPPALAAVTPQPPPPPSVDLTKYMGAILGEAVETRAMVLTAKKLLELGVAKDFGVMPPFAITVLDRLKEVEYPTEALFLAAVRARVQDEFMVKTNTNSKNGSARFDKVLKAPAEIQALGVPPEYLGVIEKITSQHFESTRQMRDAMRREFDKITEPHLERVAAAAIKSHPLQQREHILWSGNDCGCVETNRLPGGWVEAAGHRSPGVVYGLFPLWQAGREQKVDFSVLSAVGYFALGVDNEGGLIDPMPAEGAHLEFTRQARRHGTRVDWVIRRVDWSKWPAADADKQQAFYNRLKDEIVKMLVSKDGGWLRSLAETLSLGAVPQVRRGDGVTLYFKNYPDEAEAVTAFQRFHRDLTKSLQDAIGKDHSVNLLIEQRAIGKGIFECGQLAEMTQRKEDEAIDRNGKFLVLLEEPTIDQKKELRKKLEDCLTGDLRRDVLQSVVPVVQYDGVSEQQLHDDIVYFDFNFGGVGLWPHPVGSDAAAGAQKGDERVTVERVGGDIREILLGGSEPPSAVDAKLAGVCAFVCPNRWIFRGLFEAYAAVVVLSLVVRWASCRLRYLLTSQPMYFYLYMAFVALPFLVLFLALLYCDPAWARIRAGNVPFLLLAVVFFIFVIRLYVNARKEASRP